MIAGFSLVGIALGVGTLIVVHVGDERLSRRAAAPDVGINGQLGVQGNRGGLDATPELLAA